MSMTHKPVSPADDIRHSFKPDWKTDTATL